ncbi:OPT-domain-containing protein [Martensiomyces pterosporus]|nr:OPT-domain-containing protein [Martensiomyces pterosporus]
MFIVGAVLPIPVWYMQRRYPLSLWKYIHIPVLISSTALMPPAPTTTVTSWFFVCFVVNFVAYRHRYTWWQKYAFALSAALDSSVGLASVFIYLVFYLTSTEMPSYWGTKTNHCPLAANSGYKNYKNFS